MLVVVILDITEHWSLVCLGTIVDDMSKEGVVQPALVNLSELSLATECVGMILKIDDLVPVR